MQKNMGLVKSLILGIAVLGLAGSSWSQPITGFTSANSTGNFTTTGSSQGIVFNVTGLVHISGLGVFDAGSDGFVGTLQVGIFRSDNTLMGSLVSFNNTDPGLLGAGSYRFKGLSGGGFTLGSGTYAIVARGFSSNDLMYNKNVGSQNTITVNEPYPSAVDFTGTRFGDFGTISYPINFGHPSPDFYGAGNLVYNVVPEPVSMSLFGLGLAPVVVALRRRRK